MEKLPIERLKEVSSEISSTLQWIEKQFPDKNLRFAVLGGTALAMAGDEGLINRVHDKDFHYARTLMDQVLRQGPDFTLTCLLYLAVEASIGGVENK